VIDAHGRHAQDVHFTRDGRLLLSVGQDARVRLWSVPGFAAAGTFEGHKNCVCTISFTPDQKLLATGSTDGTVRLWSFPDGRCLHVLDKQRAGVVSPAGDRVATISMKGQVALWDAKSGRQVVALPSLDKRTTALAFSADGSTLLVGGTGPIHRVAVAEGRKEGEMAGHKLLVTALRVSPDGRRLASLGADGHLRIWSTKNWTEVRSVQLNGGGFHLAFAPKGDSVTVASDHAVQTYAVKDGAVLDRIEVPLKGLYGVAISPDGGYLANAAADGRVRVWERKPPRS
jgi:WD40 repeat protein